MKVTITIEDDGEGRFEWGDGTEGATEGSYIKGPDASGPYIKGPYIKGPSLVIPRDDGPDAHLDISELEAILEERKGA